MRLHIAPKEPGGKEFPEVSREHGICMERIQQLADKYELTLLPEIQFQL